MRSVVSCRSSFATAACRRRASASWALAARLGIEGVVVVRTVPGPADRAGLRGVIAATGEIGDLLAEQPEQHRQTVGAENQRQDTAGFPWATRLPH
jgi:hypothetical protein